jgi:hypothetical protein
MHILPKIVSRRAKPGSDRRATLCSGVQPVNPHPVRRLPRMLASDTVIGAQLPVLDA